MSENPGEVQPQVPSANQPEAPAGVRRRLPRGYLVRLLLIGISLIVVCGVVTVIIFQINRNARRAPIEVEIFPNAQLITQDQGINRDMRFYKTAASVKDVYTFYRSRLGDGESRGCKLIYTTAEPSEEPGKFYARCIVDNSQDDLSQVLKITITYASEDGMTGVLFERVWGG